MTVYLAFDIGTTVTKAALITHDGQILRSTTHSYPTHSSEGGILEQNVADWWTAIVACCQKLAPKEAEAIALTGQMQNLILVNANTNAVRPVILYSDTRARAEVEQLEPLLAPLREITGNWQGADSLLAKLMWVQKHEPHNLAAATEVLLGAADYAALRLTGKAATDSTTASTTGLLDLNTRALLDPFELNLPKLAGAFAKIPDITSGGTQVGTLLSTVATELGLRAGIPVYHGPGDAGAATLGTGAGEKGMAYGYLGTSGWVAFTAEGSADADSGVITLAHPRFENTIHVAPLLTAGGNLTWIKDLFNQDYDTLIEMAEGVTPSRLLYLPYLSGERSPFVDPLARGAFIGLNAHTSQADIVVAVLEGVAFAYRHALTALSPTFPRRLMLIGGGAQSGGWAQIFADVLGVEIIVPSDAEHIGLYGAVIAAEVARGTRSNYSVSHISAEAYVPRKAQHSRIEALYQLFVEAYPSLKDLFGKLSRVD